MEKINYKVVRANQEQMEWVFNKHWNNPEERQKARERFNILFVAIDENENIIGRLTIVEKTIEPPLNGTNWWIATINTYMAYRRKGIASAMLKEAIKHAEQANVRNLQASANPTLEANMFWLKNNFCFFKYAQKIDNPSNPEKHGNYPHMIFYRIDNINKIEKENQSELNGYRIVKADKEQANCILDDYMNPGYFKDKRDDIFVLFVIDEGENIAGFITAYEDEMYAPLDGTQWVIPYIFVRPELRRQGIGSALVREMIKSAKESNITQLTAVKASDATEFWHNNNFAMFYWSAVGKVVNTAVVTGLRIL